MSARKLVSGFALLMAATLLTQVFGFAALAIAARRLGPEHLGAATFVLTLAIYIGIPANFGLTVLAMREIAAEPERRRAVIGEVLTLRALLGAAGAGMFIALAPVLAADDETRELIPLAALALAADVISGEWVLMGLAARHRSRWHDCLAKASTGSSSSSRLVRARRARGFSCC